MMVTSSGISFCSMRSRAVRKSVSDADGNPISISLSPTEQSVLNSRFLVSRLMGSNRAWLPSRRSVLHHTGTVVERARWPLPVRQVDGRTRAILFRRVLQHGCFSARRYTRLLRVGSRQGFQSCWRRLVARVCVRLGRKKQERTKQRGRRGVAEGHEARLFVAIHGRQPTTDAGASVNWTRQSASQLSWAASSNVTIRAFMGAGIPCLRPSRTMTPLRSVVSPWVVPARRSATSSCRHRVANAARRPRCRPGWNRPGWRLRHVPPRRIRARGCA